MKIFKNVILAIWLIGLVAVYVHLLWGAVFKYNEEEDERADFAEERAQDRVKALENMKLEAMCNDDRFNNDCD